MAPGEEQCECSNVGEEREKGRGGQRERYYNYYCLSHKGKSPGAWRDGQEGGQRARGRGGRGRVWCEVGSMCGPGESQVERQRPGLGGPGPEGSETQRAALGGPGRVSHRRGTCRRYMAGQHAGTFSQRGALCRRRKQCQVLGPVPLTSAGTASKLPASVFPGATRNGELVIMRLS